MCEWCCVVSREQLSELWVLWEKFPIAVCGLCGRVNVNVVSVDGLGECSEGVLGVTPEVCSVGYISVVSVVDVFGCPNCE